ncbi:Holliday junction resolvase RuvX [Sneathiella sp. CAU 1612]|jgi:putative holliday junction resolvase|uniref:Putative pre-16S rRNA nuclease n=1 Tax=Sneathiella sedimenti TaxID=2816034 RepID=A0ABS3F786_9PROT|nr:Holliday junction resolvase RuvX [Sneathiella sedimenti]MBO0334379.1 Holliday junction resolvase RuvX [Sneathiella sedimenti]
MLLDNPTHLKHLLPLDKRLLGMDPGTKTIGLAISDPGLKIGTPLMTIKRTKFKADAEEIRKIIEKWSIGGFVIGLPINMDGSEGPRCQSIRQFQKNLEEFFDLPMCFWDERLSTAAMTRSMIDADASRQKRAKAVDKMAAAYILQGALDSMR